MRARRCDGGSLNARSEASTYDLLGRFTRKAVNANMPLEVSTKVSRGGFKTASHRRYMAPHPMDWHSHCGSLRSWNLRTGLFASICG